MIIEQILELGQPRREVWCVANELINNGDGTYSFANLDNNALGFASKVNVIDSNKVFLFNNSNGVLYPWTQGTSGSGGGGSDINIAYGIIGTNETTTTIYFTGDFINAYAIDNNNNKVTVDMEIELGYVTFTLEDQPVSQINCVVIYA